jgi:hypothetical protein
MQQKFFRLSAKGRGFPTASVLFSICAHQCSSAAKLAFAFFRTLVSGRCDFLRLLSSN